MEDKRFALLIDSDNISAKYISSILDEMTKYGIITYKRIYGDWTSTQTTKWKEELLSNSIIPIQQFSNTSGKNATDSALIIDAMDILYTNNVDGFCIVSSDSDFTRLASRLRESGMTVIGMGEEKTPRSFRAACTVFTGLEILIDQDEEEDNKDDISEIEQGDRSNQTEAKGSAKKDRSRNISNVINKSIIENAIVDIITENENNGKATGLGEIGSRLVNKYPDFDVRNYGYSLLSKFLEETSSFELKKQSSTVTVLIKENRKVNKEIVEYLKDLVKSADQKGIGINELSNKIHLKYPKFNLKDYGYSQFSKFVQSIEGISVIENANKRKIATIEPTDIKPVKKIK